MDLFENAVFMLSCGRLKTELFENADVTVSIYCISEHVLGSLGITRGHVACLFSFIEVQMPTIIIDIGISLVIEYRIANVTLLSCGRGYFRKRIKRIKKTRFHKYPDTLGRSLKRKAVSNCKKEDSMLGRSTNKQKTKQAAKVALKPR